MRRITREPLVGFVVVAAMIVVLYLGVAPRDRDPRRIVVSPAVRDALRADHLRRTGRAPSPGEVDGLVARWIEDEALYREALDLGLDRGDVIVRRRLRQKMEMVAEAEAVPEPSEAELVAYLDAHAERWGVQERLSFEHVFVSTERHGDASEGIARAHRAALEAGAEARPLGDPFLRGRDLVSVARADVAAVFGPAFADAVMTLPVGAWSEPVRSSYGLHVVRVRERTAGRKAILSEVRSAVQGAWVEARRLEARHALVAALRRRWPVRVEGRG